MGKIWTRERVVFKNPKKYCRLLYTDLYWFKEERCLVNNNMPTYKFIFQKTMSLNTDTTSFVHLLEIIF